MANRNSVEAEHRLSIAKEIVTRSQEGSAQETRTTSPTGGSIDVVAGGTHWEMPASLVYTHGSSLSLFSHGHTRDVRNASIGLMLYSFELEFWERSMVEKRLPCLTSTICSGSCTMLNDNLKKKRFETLVSPHSKLSIKIGEPNYAVDDRKAVAYAKPQ